jgi:hypothetical protein
MSRLLEPVRAGVLAVLRRPLLILIHLGGNAALVVLFYLWLGLADRTAGDLVISAVLLLLIVCGALWLYGVTMAAFHARAGQPVFFQGLRRLPKFAPWGLLIGAVVAAVVWRWPRFPFWLTGAATVLAILPLASQAAGGGFTTRDAVKMLGRPHYWLAGILAVVLGLYLPKLLLGWVPETTGLLMQSISLVFRSGLAALLAVISWLALSAVIGQMGRQPVP